MSELGGTDRVGASFAWWSAAGGIKAGGSKRLGIDCAVSFNLIY